MPIMSHRRVGLLLCNRLWLTSTQTTISATSVFTAQRKAHTNETFNGNSYNNKKLYAVVIGASVAATYGLYRLSTANQVDCEERKRTKDASSDAKLLHTTVRPELPTFRLEEVNKRNTKETGIWVTYGIGVYDITQFIPQHPGSDKIMLAAGGAIDPFWHTYQQHNTTEILTLLETFRIGNLNPDDDVGTKDLFDPWSNEPKRHPALQPTSQRPYNAEPPKALLIKQFVTPPEIFYVRNHLPVPDVNVNDYELEVEDEATGKRLSLTFEELKKYRKHSIMAAIMCGGNRRSEMHNVKAVKGLSWGNAAVGNAIWSGPKLCEILKNLGIESDDKRHVHFEGLDEDPTSTKYSASITLSKAMDPRGDVILAYEMNGVPLPRDHGHPVRVIVPGVVGARNVKWLGRITICSEESDSHWQKDDYKGFSPSINWDNVDFSKSPAIQNMPVTSAICSPLNDEAVKVVNGYVTVKGYAWSGGGNKIVRVDITGDGGKTWQTAELEQETNDLSTVSIGRHWSWTLWTAKVPVSKGTSNIEIWSKAVDSSYNVQPESFENIWNLRGMLSNAYSRVKVQLNW